MDRILNSWLVIAVTSVVLIIWIASLQRKRKAHRPALPSSVTFTFKQPVKLNDYVYEVHRPAGRRSVEIMFFHGLQLEASKEVYLNTWLSADGSQLWLTWILNEFPDARILLISYDASAWRTFEEGLTDMYITCENLVHSLTDDKAQVAEDGCPVLLVGHSLGGLVMKVLCTKLHETVSRRPNQRVENLLLNVKGLFFYACPHHGSRLADSSTSASKGLLFEDVTTLNKETQRRNEYFRELRLKYGWETYGIAEGRPTTWGVFKNIQIVTEASARQDVDGFYTKTDADHFNVCRPTSMTSSSFRLLSDFITQVLEKAPEEQGPKIDVPHAVIGLEEQVRTILEKLKAVPRIGIVGMGGIGKTTLANVVFNTISVGFEYSCFLGDVKTLLRNQSDLDYLQEKIKEKLFHRRGKVDKSFDWTSLKQKEVLIVLDDVNCESQVQVMTLSDAFSSKSRLIVTSRDCGFLQAEKFDCHFVKPLDIENSERLFRLNAFNPEDQLINYKDRVRSIVEKCKGFPLALRVVGKYLYAEQKESLWDDALRKLRLAQPLTGAKTDPLWSMLILSYEALAPNEQQMFLDVSTCFHGEDLDVVKGVWTACGWASTHSGLKNLLDKGLVTIEEDRIQMHEVLRDLGRSIACPDHKSIACHSRLCYDGSNPLETQSLDGENFEVKILKISWVPCINIQMLHGLKELKILWLYGTILRGPWNLLPPKLAYIRIQNCGRIDGGASNRREGLPFQSIQSYSQTLGKLTGLRHLEIHESMGDLLGTLGELQGLQHLSINEQELEALPESIWQLQALESLAIISCRRVKYIPSSLGQLLSLKSLVIHDCKGLGEIPFSLGQLLALESLKIRRCPGLGYIPNSLGQLLNLKCLVIQDCKSLRAIPDSLGRLQALEDLRLSGTGSEAPPHGLEQLKALRHLEITWCRDTKALLDALQQLPALQKLVIRSRPSLYQNYPSFIDQVQFLESLTTSLTTTGRLQRVGQVDLPVFCEDSVEIIASELQVLPWRFRQLTHAKFLTIICSNLTHLPDTLGHLQALECLEIQDCDNLEALPPTLGELRSLRKLKIQSCGRLVSLPDSLGKLQALETLSVEDCNSLESLPRTIVELQTLQCCIIDSCKHLMLHPYALGRLRAQGDLLIEDPWTKTRAQGDLLIEGPWIKTRTHIEALPDTLGGIRALRRLEISCTKLKSLPDALGNLQALEYLEIRNCNMLDALPGTLGQLRALRELKIESCERLKSLPESLGNLQALEALEIRYRINSDALLGTLGELRALRALKIDSCEELKSLPDSLGNLQALEYLKLRKCNMLDALPGTLGQLRALRTLKIDSCEELKSLPDSLGNLQELDSLDISNCNMLDALPGTLGQLRALRTLKIDSCEELKSLPDSLGNLQELDSLDISNCNMLDALPGTLGQLRALRKLKIDSCKELKSLPDSLGNLQELDSLEISKCNMLKSLPDSLGNLQALVSLKISDCNMLDALPGTLGQLRALRYLGIVSCKQLKSLPDSFANLQGLEELVISSCNKFDALPGTLGELSALQMVSINGAIIANQIYQLDPMDYTRQVITHSRYYNK